MLRVHSKELIFQEGKTLTDLLLNVHNSAVSLSLIPFCALFTGKCSKGKKMPFESDNQQSQIFRNKLRFSFIKNLNIHFNLGVYFNENGKVVFDTQLANFYINILKDIGKTPDEHAIIVGEKLGSQIAEMIARINSVPTKKSQSFRLDKLITAKEKELTKNGEITQQDY